MSDAKTDYTDAVNAQKDAATRDSMIADLIQQGYARKAEYGAEWDTVDINDVVSVVAPGAKPVVVGARLYTIVRMEPRQLLQMSVDI